MVALAAAIPWPEQPARPGWPEFWNDRSPARSPTLTPSLGRGDRTAPRWPIGGKATDVPDPRKAVGATYARAIA